MISGLFGNFALADSMPPICAANHCGLFSDGAYPNLVIGKLAHIGTDEEMKQVYQWAKSHGYWQNLPNSADPYFHDLKLVTITLPPGQGNGTITVIMQKEEFNSAPYVVGDLVRYSPHDAVHEAPKGSVDAITLFHKLSGCVATLCRQGDATCAKSYQDGVFNTTQGIPVSLKTGQEVDGTRINPLSLLPIH